MPIDERRTLLKMLGIGLVGSTLLGCKQEKQKALAENTATNASTKAKPIQWRMVTAWPKNFPMLGAAPETFANLVERLSGGRLTIKVYGAGDLIPAHQVFDTVSRGNMEIGHGAAYYWKGKLPAAQFFTAVPFGLNAQELNGWLHHAGGGELWRSLYEPFNLVPFAGGNTGVQMAGWFNRKINALSDLKGLKMRIPGLGGEVFKRAGGIPVTLPGSEIFTSLKSGAIDATEWVGPFNDMAFGLHQAAKYYYYPGWHEPGSCLEFIVNKNALSVLPEDLQTMVEVAARYVNTDMLDEATAKNNAALQTLKEQYGIQVLPLPDEVLSRLKTLSAEVLADIAKTDQQFAKIKASFEEYAKGVKAYHELSEVTYYRARGL